MPGPEPKLNEFPEDWEIVAFFKLLDKRHGLPVKLLCTLGNSPSKAWRGRRTWKTISAWVMTEFGADDESPSFRWRARVLPCKDAAQLLDHNLLCYMEDFISGSATDYLVEDMDQLADYLAYLERRNGHAAG